MRALHRIAIQASVLVVGGMLVVSQARAQSSAVQPSTAAAVHDSSYARDPELARAIDAVVRHRHREAITLARGRVQSSPMVAWRVIGVSACSRKDKGTAVEARGNLDAEGRSLVDFVCHRSGIDLPASKSP